MTIVLLRLSSDVSIKSILLIWNQTIVSNCIFVMLFFASGGGGCLIPPPLNTPLAFTDIWLFGRYIIWHQFPCVSNKQNVCIAGFSENECGVSENTIATFNTPLATRFNSKQYRKRGMVISYWWMFDDIQLFCWLHLSVFKIAERPEWHWYLLIAHSHFLLHYNHHYHITLWHELFRPFRPLCRQSTLQHTLANHFSKSNELKIQNMIRNVVKVFQ